MCISSGFRTAPVRAWLSAGTARGRCGHMNLYLLHFSPSSSLRCLPPAPKRKTPCVSSHTFLHPPLMLPSCSTGQHQRWVSQVPGVSPLKRPGQLGTDLSPGRQCCEPRAAGGGFSSDFSKLSHPGCGSTKRPWPRARGLPHEGVLPAPLY